MKKSKIMLGAMATLLAVGVASCGKDPTEVLNRNYVTTYTADMYTYDYLNTYHASDSEVLVNLVDGLVEHDVYGLVRPALAKSWKKTVDADGNEVYTFKLREGIYWYTAEGEKYAEVVAQDFVDGMHHLLDTGSDALGYIVWGVIKNATEYGSDGTITDFDQVGVKAKSKYEVEYTLEGQVPYFLRMLEYNPFMPMNKEFFESKDGVFGLSNWSEHGSDCKFGEVGEIDSILYNGAFMFSKYASESVMELKANEHYWDADNVKLDTIKYIYSDGSNPLVNYNSFVNGGYSSIGISDSILVTAKEEHGDDLYVVDTNSTTYYGTFNLNRKTYTTGSIVSPKTEAQKADTKAAILNKNFRKAIQAAFDKATWNAASVGDELKLGSLRNTLTAPEFLSLESDFGTYKKGAYYGDVVEAEFNALAKANTITADKVYDLSDGCDAYYDTAIAKKFAAAAKAELTNVTFPVHLDVVYYNASVVQKAQAEAFKQAVEAAFGDGQDFVVVDLVTAATTADYYAAGYRSATGETSNFDFFYGSGWGPDYGDPLTYLNIFGYQNDMMSVIGIGAANGTYGADDKAAYDAVLPDYATMLEDAKKATGAERIVKFAKLEAYFLDSAVATMTTTQGGNYAVTRIEPHTIPYTLYGTDNEKLKHLVIHDHILSNAEIENYRSAWSSARSEAINSYNESDYETK